MKQRYYFFTATIGPHQYEAHERYPDYEGNWQRVYLVRTVTIGIMEMDMPAMASDWHPADEVKLQFKLTDQGDTSRWRSFMNYPIRPRDHVHPVRSNFIVEFPLYAPRPIVRVRSS